MVRLLKSNRAPPTVQIRRAGTTLVCWVLVSIWQRQIRTAWGLVIMDLHHELPRFSLWDAWPEAIYHVLTCFDHGTHTHIQKHMYTIYAQRVGTEKKDGDGYWYGLIFVDTWNHWISSWRAEGLWEAGPGFRLSTQSSVDQRRPWDFLGKTMRFCQRYWRLLHIMYHSLQGMLKW